MSQIMKPRDVFALIVRIAGLVSLLYILGSSFLLAGFGLPWPFMLRAVVWLVGSIWLLRGAPQLVRFAYPDSD
jgi:hypothetical protein